jgi:hypothetical protein
MAWIVYESTVLGSVLRFPGRRGVGLGVVPDLGCAGVGDFLWCASHGSWNPDATRRSMMESTRERAQSFAKFMASLPPEEIARVNELNRRNATEQHKQFSEAFKAGRCSFCDNALTAFDSAKPCRHWLLKPEGVRKEHIEQIAAKFSWGILENYLRWVANEEAFAKNINDLADEGTGKLLELTIKYKTLEWSFSCGESDLAGHEGRRRSFEAATLAFPDVCRWQTVRPLQ